MASAEDGEDRQSRRQPLRPAPEPFAGFRRQCGQASQGQRPPGFLRLCRCGGRSAFSEGNGLHAQALDQALQGFHVFEAMAHAQQALHQVEFQRFYGLDLAQRIADQAFLGGAVHGVDAQAAPAWLRGGGNSGQFRRGVTGRMVMLVAAMLAHRVNSCLTLRVALHTL
jgi:hypothetical protein